jgi:gamma-glutamylcysteine synthetase
MRIAAKKRPNEDVAEILLKKKQEYDMKVIEKMHEKENLELVGCTFHPNIL